MQNFCSNGERCLINIVPSSFFPATIHKQNWNIVANDKGSHYVIAITAIQYNVVEKHLMLRIKPATNLEALVRTNGHPIRPGCVPGVIGKEMLHRPLVQTTTYLPGAESGELHNQGEADNKRQPSRQWLLVSLIHVIILARF